MLPEALGVLGVKEVKGARVVAVPNLSGQFKPVAVGRVMPIIAVPPENLAVRTVWMGRRVIVVVTVARDV